MWHTTESPWVSVDSMFNVLRDKNAAAHFVIGGRAGTRHPVAIQMLPLNEAARTLRHPSGPETNRANCVQVEICGRAAESGDWPRDRYKALANLVRLVNRVQPNSLEVPRTLARRFSNMNRFTGEQFVNARGHCGHQHAPGNDHVDPGSEFRGQLLMRLLKDMPNGGYDL